MRKNPLAKNTRKLNFHLVPMTSFSAVAVFQFICLILWYNLST